MKSALFLAAGLLTAGVAHAEDVTAETTYDEAGFETLIKVVEPENANCRITDRGVVQTQTVPFAVRAEPHMYYDVQCTLPGGAVWQKKVEARPGKIASIRLKGSGGGSASAPAPTVVVKVEPVAQGPQAMAAGAFGALKQAVEDASFSDDKINVISAAVGSNHFTIAQVGALVDALDHSSDKVRAVELVRGKIIDPGNAFQLASHFDFSSDKDKVLGMFK